MAGTPANTPLSDDQDTSPAVDELLTRLSAPRFRDWYRDRQWQQNIANGQPYFNGPPKIPDPDRHSPSQLLQCHRKIVYRQENAPSEQQDPHGIYWFGNRFEQDLLEPFLNQAVTNSDTYVQNSIWIDYTVETAAGPIQIKGATDPVIVTADAEPILPLEAKTKSSVRDLTEPNPHHRAQLHAYLVGLSHKFDQTLSEGALVYGGRENLQLKVFHVEFDEEFWEEQVLEWAATHTQHRIDEELPPADPEYEWECRFCSYRHRCGRADSPHQDHGPDGLLPGFDQYPREAVIEYLESNPDESLTPTLARRYPDLIDPYGVANWYCSTCDAEISWDEVDPDGDPLCPRCVQTDELSPLSLTDTE